MGADALLGCPSSFMARTDRGSWHLSLPRGRCRLCFCTEAFPRGQKRRVLFGTITLAYLLLLQAFSLTSKENHNVAIAVVIVIAVALVFNLLGLRRAFRAPSQ